MQSHRIVPASLLGLGEIAALRAYQTVPELFPARVLGCHGHVGSPPAAGAEASNVAAAFRFIAEVVRDVGAHLDHDLGHALQVVRGSLFNGRLQTAVADRGTGWGGFVGVVLSPFGGGFVLAAVGELGGRFVPVVEVADH